MTYRIVNTDNFGGDYPNERFIKGDFDSKEEAQECTDDLNDEAGENNQRYFKVVEMPYVLQPGFEP